MSELCKEWNQLAVIDGEGEHAEVHLYLEADDGDDFQMLPWPKDWPEWASADFHEHVHNGIPPEVFNKALDGQDGIAQCSRRSHRGNGYRSRSPSRTTILSVRTWGESLGVAKR